MLEKRDLGQFVNSTINSYKTTVNNFRIGLSSIKQENIKPYLKKSLKNENIQYLLIFTITMGSMAALYWIGSPEYFHNKKESSDSNQQEISKTLSPPYSFNIKIGSELQPASYIKQYSSKEVKVKNI